MRNILERQWRAWKEGREDGFTLIELLVVLLILGILLGIAIPTFLAVTHSAGTATAESNLDTALTTADSYYESNQQSFQNLMQDSGSVSDLSQQGGNVNFVDGGSTGDKSISVAWGDQTPATDDLGQIVGLSALNQNGNDRCYVIIDVKQTLNSTDISTTGFEPQGGTTAASSFEALGSSSAVAAGTYYGWFNVGASSQSLSNTSCTPVQALATSGGVATLGSGSPGAWSTDKFPAG